ncbi:hypothetical protein [Pseudomonas sp. Q1-7]|nr:hypothetical protein [Pseudomonas sp. Q1-7]
MRVHTLPHLMPVVPQPIGLVIATGGSRFRLAPAWEASISAQRPRNSSAA